jgi:formylglycine-generating enzyme required for sulfatase activity
MTAYQAILVGSVVFAIAGVANSQGIEDLKKSVVKITCMVDGKTKVGTGFIIKLIEGKAYIVTAAHVVAGDPRPQVEFYSAPGKFTADVVHAEGGQEEGLALLLVAEKQGGEPLPAGLMALSLMPDTVRSDEQVSIIGFAPDVGSWTVTHGRIVNQSGRRINFDASIEEGNSGGPLVIGSRVVGVVMSKEKRLGRALTALSVYDYAIGHKIDISLAKPGPVPVPAGVPTKEIVGKDGAPMVLVPAGEFVMGNAGGWKKNGPAHRVHVDGFYMDKYEVTLGLWKKFWNDKDKNTVLSPEIAYKYNQEKEFVPDDKSDQKPATGMLHLDARVYCSWAGKRLPTEAEWEKAARGTDERIFPWGNEEPTPDDANFNRVSRQCLLCPPKGYGDDGRLRDVGSFKKDQSPYGIFDMAGNASEMVEDWYLSDYYTKSPHKNPEGPPEYLAKTRVIRGGSWRSTTSGELYTFFRADGGYVGFDNVGFRCAKGVDRY